jgi:hypothetical protein
MPPPSAASLEVAPLDDPFCSSSISTNLACLAGIRARLRKLRPHVRATLAAGSADEARFDVR